jgi:hypothetical protein
VKEAINEGFVGCPSGAGERRVSPLLGTKGQGRADKYINPTTLAIRINIKEEESANE